MAKLEHNAIADPNIHEPKGVATAAAGALYEADGAGSGAWTLPSFPLTGTLSQGVYDYNDLATATTPIALTLAATQYELTNDGAGSGTNLTYALAALPDLWDEPSNRFIFTDGTVLALGDTVDIRFDIELTTTSINTEFDMVIELGVNGTSYQLPVILPTNFKATGTYRLVVWYGIYMGDSNTIDNPGRVLARADSTGSTVKVNGWYCRAMHTNV